MPKLRLLLVALTSCLLSACSPFLYLNAFSSAKQSREQTDIAYGALPRQRLDVYLPTPPPAHQTQVVVFFYGGGWDSGSRTDYRFVGRALSARGFITIIPDYRIYPEVLFPAFVEDAAAAVAWTLGNVSRFCGSDSQVFLMGHSAGAHIAAMLALDEKFLQSKGLRPQQLAGWIGLSGPYDFLPLKSQRLKRILGDPAPKSTQPIEFVTRSAPPALLITGDDDTVVRPANTQRLSERLQQAGSEVREIIYPGVGHGRTVAAFSGIANGLPIVDETVRFMLEHRAKPRDEQRPCVESDASAGLAVTYKAL